jgi:hypothetical protein
LTLGEHRNAPGVVEVDADRQVDLVLARVLLEGLVQAQDRVARIRLDVAGTRSCCGSFGQGLLDVGAQLFGRVVRGVALAHLAVAADEELGEVPLDAPRCPARPAPAP